MGNVIFLSPNFPTNYWQFCRELKNNGMNVLGIGDCPYDQLSEELPRFSMVSDNFRHRYTPETIEAVFQMVPPQKQTGLDIGGS